MTRSPRRAWVVVDGRGPVPEGLTALLRSLGLARVDAGGYAADAAEVACDIATGQGRGAGPDLVVLTASGTVGAVSGRPWLARGIPHLPLGCGEGMASLGPLVLPGRSACLTCQDLLRSDLDPSWAAIAAAASAAPVLCPGPVDAGARLTPLVVALAALVIAGWLEGAAPMPGVSAEVALPWPTVVHRHWPAHPACPCGAASASRVTAGPPGGAQPAQDTMSR